MRDRIDHHIDEAVKYWPFLEAGVETSVTRISKIHRHIDQNMAERLSEVGISRGAYKVLIRLVTSGPPYQLAPSRLSEMLVMSSGAMTNRLDSLEERASSSGPPIPTIRPTSTRTPISAALDAICNRSAGR